MKVKKLLPFLLFVLFFVSCQHKDNTPDKLINSEDTLLLENSEDYSDCQNDLVYRDYGTGIWLSSNSSVTISQLDLELKDETAVICAFNLENNEVIKILDYQPNQFISFSPVLDGIYKLIAVISTGEQRDLTPIALVETTSSIDDNTSGLIFLQ
ncbi:MAG: hypothetical protein K0S04_4394 [Herbinix sp.]|jgi:hypothetical protein|nr:hypothetical protein [Herbinix sp.]